MADFEKNIQALMKGVEEHISTKTIIGEPVVYDDMTIFPMAEVSFGLATGAFNQEKKNNGVGGVGAKMSPSAILVIQNGTSKIIDIKDKSTMNKIVEMVPDIINKISESIGPKKQADVPAADTFEAGKSEQK